MSYNSQVVVCYAQLLEAGSYRLNSLKGKFHTFYIEDQYSFSINVYIRKWLNNEKRKLDLIIYTQIINYTQIRFLFI